MLNIKAVILAAGESKRMKSAISKLLHSIHTKPTVIYPVTACKGCGIKDIIVVVGYQAEKIISTLGDGVSYAFQPEPRGTGDALKKAIPFLEGYQGHLLILPGDAPLINTFTLIQFINFHIEKRPALSILTAIFSNPSHYGRVIRDARNQVMKIVEYKNATPKEKKIKEVNGGIYCMSFDIVEPFIWRLRPNKVTGEYYLTDIVELLYKKGLRIEAYVSPNPTVILGVNTPEELES